MDNAKSDSTKRAIKSIIIRSQFSLSRPSGNQSRALSINTVIKDNKLIWEIRRFVTEHDELIVYKEHYMSGVLPVTRVSRAVYHGVYHALKRTNRTRLTGIYCGL